LQANLNLSSSHIVYGLYVGKYCIINIYSLQSTCYIQINPRTIEILEALHKILQ